MLKKECLFYHKINQINELSRKIDDKKVYKQEEDEIKIINFLKNSLNKKTLDDYKLIREKYKDLSFI